VLLSAADLRFGYDAERGDRRRERVIDDVSLAVEAGEVVGLLGPNGCGKTTLLRLLSGSLAPRAGEVRLHGAPMAGLSRRALARTIAVVQQETSLAFDYTALELVLMGRYPHLGAFEVEGPADLAAAVRALQATGTADLADRPFRTLSGGEKQRVVIASALAQLDAGADAGGVVTTDVHASSQAADRLLILDEPTASLDLKYQFEIAAIVRRLHESAHATILLSTHDLRFAASICTRVILLSEGRLLATGRPADVLTPDLVGRLFDVPADLAAPILRAATAP